MYPTIHIGGWLSLYTFGLFMIIAWAVFFTLLHYNAIRRSFTKHIFSNIIDFTLSIFFFWRLFYIFSDWRTERFLFVDLFESGNIFVFLRDLFITDNYSLSFAGGIVWFIIVFIWKTWNIRKDREKYWDVIIPAFLIAAPIWYIWALLGGQIYGIVLDTFFSITYSNFDSIVPFQNPTFPLPIFYALFSLITALFIYRIEEKIVIPEWFIWYIGMGVFAIILFLGEFLNGASDLFSSRVFINLNQIIALCIITYSLIWLVRITK